MPCLKPQIQLWLIQNLPLGLPTANLVCFPSLARLSPGVANLYIKTVPLVSFTFLIISSVFVSKRCARYVAFRDRATCSSVTMKKGEQVLRRFVERRS